MSRTSAVNPWTLKTRLLLLIKTKLDEKGQFKALENLTGIKANHWRDCNAGKQRPTAEMIEAVSRLWPEHAFWLATGISDPQHGHSAPHNGNFPYKAGSQVVPAQFFSKGIETLDACVAAFMADEDFNDEETLPYLFLDGLHRSTLKLGLEKNEAKRRHLESLFSELQELHEARQLEYEIKETQSHEDYEETALKLPERISKLRQNKRLASSSVEHLEALLKAERENLERYQRISARLMRIPDGN